MQLIPILTLQSMTVEQQDKLIRQAIGIAKQADAATKAHKSSFPMLGKLICIAEERLNDLKSDRNPDGTSKKRQIAANTSLATYWESITRVNGKDGQKVNPHGYSCAVAFGTYVHSDLIGEADYDKNTAQCLEIAASIATECGGDVTHACVIEAADELKDRSKDSAKNLRSILETVKEPKPLTPEKATAMLATLFAGGFLSTVIAAMGAEIAHLTDRDVAKSAFMGLDTAVQMFGQNTDENNARRFDDDLLESWSREISEAEMKRAADAKAAADKLAADEAAAAQKLAQATEEALNGTPENAAAPLQAAA